MPAAQIRAAAERLESARALVRHLAAKVPEHPHSTAEALLLPIGPLADKARQTADAEEGS